MSESITALALCAIAIVAVLHLLHAVAVRQEVRRERAATRKDAQSSNPFYTGAIVTTASVVLVGVFVAMFFQVLNLRAAKTKNVVSTENLQLARIAGLYTAIDAASNEFSQGNLTVVPKENGPVVAAFNADSSQFTRFTVLPNGQVLVERYADLLGSKLTSKKTIEGVLPAWVWKR